MNKLSFVFAIVIPLSKRIWPIYVTSFGNLENMFLKLKILVDLFITSNQLCITLIIYKSSHSNYCRLINNMNVEKGVKKLEDVVEEYIDKTKEIIRKEVSLFSCPGENNGGVLLKAELTLRKKKDYGSLGDENLSLIIKTIPPTEYFQILFNTQVSVKVEIAFYEVIVPTFSDFQRRLCGKTNDLFPKYYGGRISLDKSSDRVDNDSVIILQNLQKEGIFCCTLLN